MQEFTINKEASGQTLVKYLNRLLKDAPNGLIYKQIRKKNIVLNGKKCEGNEKLKDGDIVKIFMSDETISKFKGALNVDTTEYERAFNKFKNPTIIYEDEHIIVLDKPVGMLSQKSDTNDYSCNEWLIGYLLNKNELSKEGLSKFVPSICNRLDRNTGGLLTFGKTPFGTITLNKLIKEREVSKYYLTVVKGKIDSSSVLEGYLFKDEHTNKVEIFKEAKEGSDYIKTIYKPLRYNKEFDLQELEVELVTGKPHQIRAHLASINHPIIGDVKYGDKRLNELALNRYKLKHQFLYAYKMVFPKLDNYEELSDRTIIKDCKELLSQFFGE